MNYAFVTYLGTDNFLPGILVLNHSLKKHNKMYDLVVLINETVSASIAELLVLKEIKFKTVKPIENPNDLINDERNFKNMYTKLRIFEMFEYDKVVYLDADMLVCNNIEELFNHPHMAAVVAGALFPTNESWKDLNAGLMIIEPDKNTFNKLFSLINQLPSIDGSDQGFLHSFYKDWPSDKSKQLDHRFNVPFVYIDEYCRLHDYKFSFKKKVFETNIAVIHYWGRYKPWEMNIKLLQRNSTKKMEQSLILWWDVFLEQQK